MGADPEFTLVRAKDGTQIYANDLVAVLGSEYPVVNMGVQMNGGIFGHDGHASTAELRPNPSSTPGELTRNLGLMIRELEFLTASRANAVTDSGIEQVGGHVHISVPRDVPPHVLNAVNWTLFLCAPLLKMTSDTTRSSRVDYGQLDDVRYDMHDGTRTAELRFLPAEWLTTPRTTEAVLSYIACVYYEALNNQEQVASVYKKYLRGKIHEFNFQTLQSLEEEIPLLFELVVSQIKKDIRGFACYEQYKPHIRYALRSGEVKKKNTGVKYDVFSGWCPRRTAPPVVQERAQPTNEQFLSLKKHKDIGLQDAVAGFIDNYGRFSNMISDSGGRDMRDLERSLRTRVECTGLNISTPVYLYGLGSSDSDQITSFKRGKVNNPTRNDYVLRDVAAGFESHWAIVGIPRILRLPENMESTKIKLADYFFKMQTNQLTYK